MQDVLNVISAVMGGLTAVGMLLHAFKLDDKPWAKTFLAFSNDIVGAYKGYVSNKKDQNA